MFRARLLVGSLLVHTACSGDILAPPGLETPPWSTTEQRRPEVADPTQRCSPLMAGAAPAPTFVSDVRAIVVNDCGGCHGPGRQQPDLTDYLVLSGATLNQALGAIAAGAMPPPASGYPRMSASDHDVLAAWLAASTPYDRSQCLTPQQPPPAAPSCVLVASSTTLTAGDSTDLTLTVSGAFTAASLDGRPLAASAFDATQTAKQTVTPQTTGTVHALVTGPGGEGRCSIALTVMGGTAPPRASFTGWPIMDQNHCTGCHQKWFGTFVSTRYDFRGEAGGSQYVFLDVGDVEVVGRWLHGGDVHMGQQPTSGDDWAFQAPGRSEGPFTVDRGVVPHATGDGVPKLLDGNGRPAFPPLDYAEIEAGVSGRVQTSGTYAVTIDRVHQGSVVLVGTTAQPIRVSGDVLVKGDLVIKGTYTGIGTIYVTGNIYVVANLKAQSSPFPFPDDETQALAYAQTVLAKDGLALATSRFTFLGDVRDTADWANHGSNHDPTYDTSDDAMRVQYFVPSATNVYSWKSWFPGGAAAMDALYEPASGVCHVLDDAVRDPDRDAHSFELVDAFLYAEQGISGWAWGGSFSIRGGVATRRYHVHSSARDCGAPAGTVSPVHGRDPNYSYLEYDYRIRTGQLPILQFLSKYY